MIATRLGVIACTTAALILLAPDPCQSEQQSKTNVVPPSLIVEIQTLLSRHGYNPGSIDGIIGARTKAAALEFMSDASLPNRTADDPRKLLGVLHVWTTNIQRAEEMLEFLEYETGPADGIVDAMTERAIRSFQIASRVAPSGKFSWALLDSLTERASAATHSEGTGRRSILARMVSAGLVQTKGLGSSLCS
jgi:peptidoglycan hydrolase-like protein with peptidoglycan-binding domain